MRGFTLVEVLIMVAVMGIIAAAAVPDVARVTADTRADRAAETFAGALRYAQSEAVRTGVVTGVKVVLPHAPVSGDNGNWFTVMEPSGAKVVTHPASRRPYTIDFDNWGGSVAFQSFAADTNGMVSFSPLGDPVPSSGATCIVRTGDAQRTIIVRGVTGHVDVQ